MKKWEVALTLFLFYFTTQAQTMVYKNNNLDGRIRAIEDRIALKELGDTFSILADQKDVQAQTLLFTETQASRGRAIVISKSFS
jgi:hypothetical protein